MARCMFLGYSDSTVCISRPKLRAAIDQIILSNDETEFLFYQSIYKNPSYEMCLREADQSKWRSRRNVTITLFVDSYRYSDFMRQDMTCPPLDQFDRIQPIQISGTPRSRYARVTRELVEQSQYVISGIIEALYSDELSILQKARCSPACQVIDVTDGEIVRRTLERLAALPEREQLIFHMIQDGATLEEVSRRVGVSAKQVRHIYHRIGYSLTQYAGDLQKFTALLRR